MGSISLLLGLYFALGSFLWYFCFSVTKKIFLVFAEIRFCLACFFYFKIGFFGVRKKRVKKKKIINILFQTRLVLLLLGVIHFIRWAQWRVLVEQRPALAIEAAELRRQQESLNYFGANRAVEMNPTRSSEPAPTAPPPNFIQQSNDGIVDLGKSDDFSFKIAEYNSVVEPDTKT